MNLRHLARGKPCMVRIPFVCNHDSDTTVLAHLNGNKSQSSKNADLLGAWSCSACHSWLDGGYATATVPAIQNSRRDRDYYHLDAIARTQRELLKLGLQEAIDGWRELK